MTRRSSTHTIGYRLEGSGAQDFLGLPHGVGNCIDLEFPSLDESGDVKVTIGLESFIGRLRQDGPGHIHSCALKASGV